MKKTWQIYYMPYDPDINNIDSDNIFLIGLMQIISFMLVMLIT